MNSPARPLISIALCTYNAGRFLEPQLQSLLDQRDVEFEIVAVDDGSTDGTYERLLAWQGPAFRIFRNERNRGVNANFEHAFSLCRGEFIAPCDQDDVWHPEKLVRLLAAIGSGTLAYCDSSLIDEADRPLSIHMSDLRNMIHGGDPLAFAFGNCVSGHACLVRRSLMATALPIPPDFPFYDWWLALMAADRDGIAYLPERLVEYRQHAANVSDCTGDKQRRGPGEFALYVRRERMLVQIAERLRGPRRPVFAQLAAAWSERRSRWFCWRLAGLCLRHSAVLWHVERHGTKHRARDLWNMAIGLPIKRYFRPDKYPQDLSGRTAVG